MMYIAEAFGKDHYLGAIANSPDEAFAWVRKLIESEAPMETWEKIKVHALDTWVLPAPGKGLITFRFTIDPGPKDPTIIGRTDVLPHPDGEGFLGVDVPWWRATVSQLAPSGAVALEEVEVYPPPEKPPAEQREE